MPPSILRDPGFFGGVSHSKSFLQALAGSTSSFPDLKRSTFRGLPALLVSDDEIRALAEPFRFSLVGFFPGKRPPLDAIRKFFFNLKLNGDVSVTVLDSTHVLIKLENDLDYCRIFCHRSYLVFNCYMKITKWTPTLDIGVESPIIPIWISFPHLRPHFFAPRILFGLGELFGKPLKIDEATSVGSRPSIARVLVEIDITKNYPKQVWLGSDLLGYAQEVVFDDFPHFCGVCKKLGHISGNNQQYIEVSPLFTGISTTVYTLPQQSTDRPQTSNHHSCSTHQQDVNPPEQAPYLAIYYPLNDRQ
ncbi:uncharacterized protein LOC114579665 [Dendrobium catenatum]|uniref:uncharacterized protein LOC114579665 n=1 Tax=Dendrobium catenatum TaxID=906689 RepID=UPI00109F9A72|nr:uncharacterized protein LOC114579665 [Dendrobium catenatum]